MRRRECGTKGRARPEIWLAPLLGMRGQFPFMTGTAPAGRLRKPALGRRRGPARRHYGLLPGAG
jgi:hypothetical protein